MLDFHLRHKLCHLSIAKPKLHASKTLLHVSTLISTDKGFKAFEFCLNFLVRKQASLTGHVYRVSHGFTRFLMLNISALQSFQPWMY